MQEKFHNFSNFLSASLLQMFQRAFASSRVTITKRAFCATVYPFAQAGGLKTAKDALAKV